MLSEMTWPSEKSEIFWKLIAIIGGPAGRHVKRIHEARALPDSATHSRDRFNWRCRRCSSRYRRRKMQRGVDTFSSPGDPLIFAHIPVFSGRTRGVQLLTCLGNIRDFLRGSPRPAKLLSGGAASVDILWNGANGEDTSFDSWTAFGGGGGASARCQIPLSVGCREKELPVPRVPAVLQPKWKLAGV